MGNEEQELPILNIAPTDLQVIGYALFPYAQRVRQMAQPSAKREALLRTIETLRQRIAAVKTLSDGNGLPFLLSHDELAVIDSALSAFVDTINRFVPRREEKSVEVFCCYACKDRLMLLELKTHLMPLQREGLITLWADVDIQAGMEWEKEIHLHLNTAQIILLLISPDFLASEYCYNIEMQRAIERHECGEARVIPIILRRASWQKTPLGKLQALPTGANPITQWHDQDEAFYDVAKGIQKAVEARIAESENP